MRLHPTRLAELRKLNPTWDDVDDDEFLKQVDFDYEQKLGTVLPDDPEPDSGLSGILTNLGRGVSQTGRMLGATLDLGARDYAAVEQRREEHLEAAKSMPVEQQELHQAFEAIDREQSTLGQIADTIAAAARNPVGTAQLVTEQAANSLAVLAPTWAGLKFGATAGSVAGPAGMAAGAAIGALSGMFLGNYAIEAGANVIEKAEGGLTPEEAAQAVDETLTKAGVLTAVDALTFKAGSLVSRTLGRDAQKAGARAEAEYLIAQGIDMNSPAAVTKALADPAIKKAATVAGERAALQALSTRQKTGMIGGSLAMETLGEGVGEGLGTYLSTGEFDPVDATIEAIAGFSQSLVTTAYQQTNLGSELHQPLTPQQAATEAAQINAEKQKADLTRLTEAQSVDEAIQAATEAVTAPQAKSQDLLDLASTRDQLLRQAEQQTPASELTAPVSELRQVTGSQTEIVTPDGESLPAEWFVFDAATFDQQPTAETQPRDRDRAASEAQVQRIAASPDYRRTSDSPVMEVGAPVFNAEGNLIAGWGRTLGIQRAYQQGTATDYNRQLLADLEAKGIDPQAVQGMRQPVLGRRITQPVDTQAIARASNEGQTLQYSATEQAKLDAGKMQALDGIEFNDKGLPADSRQVRAALRGFSPAELGAMVDAQGNLSQEGVRRIRNAQLYQAYGDSPTLTRLVESTDQGSRNLANALLQTGSQLQKVKQQLPEGSPLDPTSALLQAVEVAERLSAQGTKVGDYLNQQQIGERELTPAAEQLLSAIDQYRNKLKQMREYLTNLYERIGDQAAAEKTATLPGMEASPVTLDELLTTPEPPAQTVEQRSLFPETGQGDIYERIETRPGTTEKQKEKGRQALEWVRTEAHRLLAAATRRGAGTVLGTTIPEDFEIQAGSTLIGQEVKSPADLALAAQVLRNPIFETFRVFFTKGGQIVHHTGISSRVPGSVTLVTPRPGETQHQASERLITELKQQYEASEADGYYLLHNHPSGRAVPSQADVQTTKHFSDALPGFISHVIIDHNEYGIITPDGGQDTIKADLGAKDTKDVLPSNYLRKPVSGPINMAVLAKGMEIAEDMFTLVGLRTGVNGVLVVGTIAEFPLSLLKRDPLYLLGALRRFARHSGSGSVVAVMPDGKKYSALEVGLRNGVILDIVNASTGETHPDTIGMQNLFSINRQPAARVDMPTQITREETGRTEGHTGNFVVPDTPEYAENTTGDLATIPAGIPGGIKPLPIRLEIGAAIGAHRGVGMLHIADNVTDPGQPQRKPPKKTSDLLEEDIARDVVHTLRGVSQIYRDDRTSDRPAVYLYNAKKKAAIKAALSEDGTYYSIITHIPQTSPPASMGKPARQGASLLLFSSGPRSVTPLSGQRPETADTLTPEQELPETRRPYRLPETIRGRQVTREPTDTTIEQDEAAYTPLQLGTFYSALEREIPKLRALAGKKGTVQPKQAIAWLDARQKEGKFKKAEVEAVGVKDWLALQTEPVPVDDIETFVARNGVRLEEVELGGASELRRAEIEERVTERITRDFENAARGYDYLEGEYWYDTIRTTKRQIMDEVAASEEPADNDGELRVTYEGVTYTLPEDYTDEDFFEESGISDAEVFDIYVESNPEDYEDAVADALENARDAIDEAVEQELERQVYEGEVRSTQFDQYQLPGGENYTELALLLPFDRTLFKSPPAHSMPGADENRLAHVRFNERRTAAKEVAGNPQALRDQAKRIRDSLSQAVTDYRNSPEARRLAEEAVRAETPDFDSRPAPVQNELISEQLYVVADEYRRNTFPEQMAEARRLDAEAARIAQAQQDAAAGDRVLFSEEFQSDWGQEGREQGFIGPERNARMAALEAKTERLYRAMLRADENDDADAATLAEAQYNEAAAKLKEMEKAQPVMPGPFVTETKEWAALILKRMLRYAADHDFKYLAWTTGQEQIDRYRLSKHLSAIAYDPPSKTFEGYDLNGKIVVTEILSPFELKSQIGEEITERLLATPQNEYGVHLLTGTGIDLGGQGMIEFYDNILRHVANDILKKLGGGRVQTIDIENIGEHMAVEITPELKSRIGDGLSVFQPQSPYGVGPSPKVETFAGPYAAQADQSLLEAAQARITSGEDPETVRQQTGWSQERDGMWRFEIDDSTAAIQPQLPAVLTEAMRGNNPASVTLADVLQHPDLFEQYPQLRDMPVTVFPLKGASPFGGWYDTTTRSIAVNYDHLAGDRIDLSALLHEVQHAVQHIEGFSGGINPKTIREIADAAGKAADSFELQLQDPTLTPEQRDQISQSLQAARNFSEVDTEEAYMHQLGEAEARNVQRRQRLTPEERTATPPDTTLDTDGERFTTEELARMLDRAGLHEAAEVARRDVNRRKMQTRVTEPPGAASVAPPEDTPAALPEATKTDWFRIRAQDAQLRFKRIQQWLKDQGTKLTDLADVYTRENISKGKTANKIEDFRNDQLKPLLKEIASSKIELADITEYLQAQHTPEANARMREIYNNPEATAAGMTDAQAQAVIDKYQRRADFTRFKTLADRVQKIGQETLDMRLEAGLISQELYDAYQNTYKHWVPLRGDLTAEDTPATQRPGTGKGMNVKTSQKRRFGHEARDEFIFENLVMDRERAIIEIEKNKVAMSVMALLLEAGNRNIGTVDQPQKMRSLRQHSYVVNYKGRQVGVFETEAAANSAIRRIELGKTTLTAFDDALKVDPRDLSVSRIDDPHVSMSARPMLAENEIQVYVNGHTVRLQLNDPLLARAATNGGIESVGALIQGMRAVNRYLSKAYTAWNPEFMGVNMVRDFGSGLVVLAGKKGADFMRKTIANYPRAIMELVKAINDPKKSEWVKQYRAAGGNIGAAYLDDIQRIGADTLRAVDEYRGALATYTTTYDNAIAQGASPSMARTKAALRAGVAGAKSLPVVGHFLSLVEKGNAVIENAMRLATFKTAIEAGETAENAAMLSKDLMNFNRKGEVATTAGGLYLFFNPAMQGAHIVGEALLTSPHRKQVWGMLGGVTALSFVLAELARGMGDDDEDEWQNIPEYVRDRNMIVKAGDTQIMIPVPYGFGWFHTIGQAMSDLFHGKDTYEVGLRVADSLIENFSVFGNPVADEGDRIQFDPTQLLPTHIKMITGPSINRDSFGRPIYPEDAFSPHKPDSQKVTRSVRGTVYDELAQFMNDATGGDRYNPGAVDISPNTIRYWVGQLTGGAGRSVVDTKELGATLLGGVIPEISEVPIVRKFARQTTVADSRQAFYKAAKETQAFSDRFKAAVKDGDRYAAQKSMAEARDIIALAKWAESSRKQAKLYQDLVWRINHDDALTRKEKRERIKVIEDREKQMYDNFLRTFRERKG